MGERIYSNGIPANEKQKGFKCCKDCTKRQLGCHDTCNEYLSAKRDRIALNERIRREQLKYNEIHDSAYITPLSRNR